MYRCVIILYITVKYLSTVVSNTDTYPGSSTGIRIHTSFDISSDVAHVGTSIVTITVGLNLSQYLKFSLYR